MLENEKEVSELRNFLKKRDLKLSDDEIEKIAQNLYKLGVFLVELQIKNHSKSKELENFEEIKREPP